VSTPSVPNTLKEWGPYGAIGVILTLLTYQVMAGGFANDKRSPSANDMQLAFLKESLVKIDQQIESMQSGQMSGVSALNQAVGRIEEQVKAIGDQSRKFQFELEYLKTTVGDLSARMKSAESELKAIETERRLPK